MSDRRCPACGALVGDDARWCGQCFAPLDGDTAEKRAGVDAPLGADAPPPEAEAAPTEGAMPRAGSAPADRAEMPDGAADAEWLGQVAGLRPLRDGKIDDPTSAAPTTAPAEAPVRRVGEGVMWACPRCGGDNALDAEACGRCGTPFADLLREPPEALRLPPPATAAALSLLFPGLGHLLCKRPAEAAARAVLFLWAAGVAVIVLLAGPSAALVTVVGYLFALAALALWVGSAWDASRLAAGEARQLISSGVMLVGTIVLTVLSVVVFVAASLRSGFTG